MRPMPKAGNRRFYMPKCLRVRCDGAMRDGSFAFPRVFQLGNKMEGLPIGNLAQLGQVVPLRDSRETNAHV